MSTLIFGKVFSSMFTGSMYGKGSHVFAVMTYVIAHMQPNKDRVEYVRLNPQCLADTLGEKIDKIHEALGILTGQDKGTHTPGEQGKRLVMESPFVYRVVNGQMYREMKDEEDRLKKDAERAARYRENHPEKAKRKRTREKGANLPDGLSAARLTETHGQEAADALADRQDQELEEIKQERELVKNGDVQELKHVETGTSGVKFLVEQSESGHANPIVQSDSDLKGHVLPESPLRAVKPFAP